jgi:N-acetylglucosamine-6-phosphate deacetylase
MKTIDIHTHGIGGYDTRSADVTHILRIAEIQSSCGVLEIVLTIYPDVISVMRENMEMIKKAMDIQDAAIISGQAKILGVHLEGPFLNPAKCGSLNATTFIGPSEKPFRELIEGFENIVKIITVAPELEGAFGLIKKISAQGIIVSMGHSDATYEEAEKGFHAGAKGITHLFNAMQGFHHREPGIAGFGLLHKDIYIEIIADPYHLHQATLELILRIKKPQRIIIVSDTVRESKTFFEEKAVTDSYGKLLGGGMTVLESAQRLIAMGYNEEIIMGCITENPHRYLNERIKN